MQLRGLLFLRPSASARSLLFPSFRPAPPPPRSGRSPPPSPRPGYPATAAPPCPRRPSGRRKRPSFQRPPLQRGGLEICAADPRYTPSAASSGRISPRKCRDMRGRPSIYAFRGIIRAHISGMRVRWRSRHQNHRRRPDVRRTANKPDLYLVEI